MRHVYTLSIAFLLLAISSAQAQTISIKSGPFQTPVLELYTSEGCSSCPPADRWLREVIKLPTQELDVLTLAFHVDYWDYIGWKDSFASPQYTNRQRMLAKANRQNSIYTPEFLLNDTETRGSRNIISKIRQSNLRSSPVQLELKVDKQSEIIDLQLTNHNLTDDDLNIEFVIFEDNLSSQVDAGENEGKQLTHQHVVRYLSPTLTLSTQLNHQIKVNPGWKTQNLGVAAIVRSNKSEFLQSLYSRI
jgi:hypothetical protein